MASSQSEALKTFQVAFSQLDEAARTRFLDALQDPPPPVKPPWIASASASQDTTQPGSASALPSTAQPGTGLSTDEPSASPMPGEERPWAGLIDGGPAQHNTAAIKEPQMEEEEPLTPPPCPWPPLQESCYHQPRPSTDSCWTAWDGSWWANYWDSTSQEPPDESTRVDSRHYAYSTDPAWHRNTRIFYHGMQRSPAKPSEPEQTQPEPAPPSADTPQHSPWPNTTPHAQPQPAPPSTGTPQHSPWPTIAPKAMPSPSTGTAQQSPWPATTPKATPSQPLDPSEAKAIAQLHLCTHMPALVLPRTARIRGEGRELYAYYIDDRGDQCCGKPCTALPVCRFNSVCGRAVQSMWSDSHSSHKCSRCYAWE